MISRKSISLLGISIAALLAISVISVLDIPQAIADDDKPKFNKKPDFVAELEPREGGPYEGFEGKAKFWLSKNKEFLKYKIETNMLLTGFDAATANEVRQIHGHLGSIFGIHIVNILGKPTVFNDIDDDAKVLIAKNIVKGKWDDKDADPSLKDVGGSTKKLSDHLKDLCNEEGWLVIHGPVVDTAVDPESGNQFGNRAIWGQMEQTSSNKICNKIDKHDDDDGDD